MKKKHKFKSPEHLFGVYFIAEICFVGTSKRLPLTARIVCGFHVIIWMSLAMQFIFYKVRECVLKCCKQVANVTLKRYKHYHATLEWVVSEVHEVCPQFGRQQVLGGGGR